MNITLKKLKHVQSRSEETHCFSADVYVDGKMLCEADNDGRGGSNSYFPSAKSPNDWREQLASIEKELGKETIKEYNIPNSLEIVVGDLINNTLIVKDVKSLIKRRVAYVSAKPGIFQLPAKYKPSPDLFEQLKKSDWWTPEHELLAEMPLERAVEFYRDNA